jgi:hypothetical protein
MQVPIWVWVLIAVIVLVVILALVGRAAYTRRRSTRLHQQFGPEYDRLVEAGDQHSAESELAERDKAHKKLHIVALTPEAQQRYTHHWQRVQSAFVDNPVVALGDADGLVTEVMRERGYPVDDFERQAGDISVDHPGVVENYREAHRVFVAQREGGVGTELQRQAFVRYRTLFDKLLQPLDSGPSRGATA